MKLKTKKFGTIIYHNCLLWYEYPRIFLCVDRFNNRYILQEWESEKDYDTWGVCDLKKWDIPTKDFWIHDTKECCSELPNEKWDLFDTLIYDYQIRLNYKDKSIIEEEVPPRKWIDGRFVYLNNETKESIDNEKKEAL